MLHDDSNYSFRFFIYHSSPSSPSNQSKTCIFRMLTPRINCKPLLELSSRSPSIDTIFIDSYHWSTLIAIATHRDDGQLQPAGHGTLHAIINHTKPILIAQEEDELSPRLYTGGPWLFVILMQSLLKTMAKEKLQYPWPRTIPCKRSAAWIIKSPVGSDKMANRWVKVDVFAQESPKIGRNSVKSDHPGRYRLKRISLNELRREKINIKPPSFHKTEPELIISQLSMNSRNFASLHYEISLLSRVFKSS